MGGGKCCCCCCTFIFFHSESGGCFRGLQKCVGKRFDGAVEFAKNGRFEKVDLGSWIVAGLWIMYMIGCCFNSLPLYPRDNGGTARFEETRTEKIIVIEACSSLMPALL